MRSLERIVLGVILLFAAVSNCHASEMDIRDFFKNYDLAFKSKDLTAISNMWMDNATHIDWTLDINTESKAEIIQDIKQVFDSSESVKLSGTVESVRFMTENVASS